MKWSIFQIYSRKKKQHIIHVSDIIVTAGFIMFHEFQKIFQFVEFTILIPFYICIGEIKYQIAKH